MRMFIKKLHEGAKLPTRGSRNAGAYDLYCSEVVKEAENVYLCKLGIAVEFPERMRLIITPRSSITKTGWFLPNSPALIDADYRGEIILRFVAIPQFNFGLRAESTIKQDNTTTVLSKTLSKIKGYPEFPYRPGDRVAQMYLEEVINIEFKQTDNLSSTDRGTGGFGSTGR